MSRSTQDSYGATPGEIQPLDLAALEPVLRRVVSARVMDAPVIDNLVQDGLEWLRDTRVPHSPRIGDAALGSDDPKAVDGRRLWAVVRPVGEIDLAVAGEFREAALQALGRSRHVAIDLSGVTFMDSTGISVIVTALKQARIRDGQLVLVGITDPVRRVLEITGLTEILDIRDALDGHETLPNGSSVGTPDSDI